MLEISAVTKAYGNLIAVDNIELSINAGEIFGLLGPNGAGKSTTISMLTGIIRPDSGEINISGSGAPHLSASRQSLGVAPQSLALYESLTALENLNFFGQMYGLTGSKLKSAVENSMQLADLESRKNDIVESYSGGMKRRLNLAAAMIHNPKLLLLDPV